MQDMVGGFRCVASGSAEFGILRPPSSGSASGGKCVILTLRQLMKFRPERNQEGSRI